MGATSQYRPDTRAPGGGGMDYNGNPVGGGMGAQFNMGGPRLQGGAYGQPIYGGSPLPGDLYNRGVNQIGQQIGVQPGGPGMIGQVLGRFQPRGMVPPAGARPQPGDMTGPYTRQRAPAGDPARYGNPRQLNPGQPGLQPGVMPPGSIGQPGGPTPMPSPVVGRGKGGGGKGGFPGPGRPGFGPAPIEDPRLKEIDPGFNVPFNFNDISGESPRGPDGRYLGEDIVM